jgi:hypothetical protein
MKANTLAMEEEKYSHTNLRCSAKGVMKSGLIPFGKMAEIYSTHNSTST